MTSMRLATLICVLLCLGLALTGCGDHASPTGMDGGPELDAEPGRDSGPPVCGNEELEGDELCDDGNTDDGDGCSANCLSVERCGNGYLDTPIGETCDDGNSLNGDGCSADCRSDETCGNGLVDIGVGEVCDDGNTEDGDGCSADCMMGPVCGDGAVHTPEQCDDGNMVGGDGCSADCLSNETCGNFVVDPGEECDDGNFDAGDGCSAVCTFERCGNGILEAGEECDDGNAVDGDGCEGDCAFTCAAASDCDDGMVCNGAEDCDVSAHLCTAGMPPAAGTACGGGLVCRGGSCVSAACGNGAREGAEQCDDGNSVDGDGCDNDCTFSCAAAADCDDANACTGTESCNTTLHTCQAGTPLADGAACGTGRVCRGGACITPVCGDGFVEGAEQCDDANGTDGDGCDSDCTFSCSAAADCDDANLCNGAETCRAATHTCGAGTPPADGVSCGVGLVCRGGACVMPVCGNGLLEFGELCDDGNSTNGDGCENDCTFSCATDGECGDGRFCNGTETCNTTTHVCRSGTPVSDGTSCGGGLVCRAGTCVPPVCGNGILETGETCDDGNTADGDGCNNDCTFSCTATADCDDANLCTGAETCNTSTHICTNPADPPDGTPCGGGNVCRGGSCVAPLCGNSLREGSEQCDDGNTTDGDGCDNDCTYSCEAAADCADGNACNGTESCNTTTHRCVAGTPPVDGTVCDRDMNPATRDICRGGTCRASSCGDTFVDSGAGEQCDDGNAVNGDGCDDDCTFSCAVAADCTDGDACNGAETCNTTTHRCVVGTPPPDGSVCDRDMNPATRDICRGGTCRVSSCGDTFVDAGGGEQCDDGNAVNGDGCDNDCTFSCAVAADCSDGNACNGAESCNTTTHRCVAGTPPADGSVCDRDMNPATRDICRGGTCWASTCGDTFVDAGGGEQCDDGNTVNGDGCDNDCTFSCAVAADCSDGNACNGTESCNTTTHRCVAGTPPANGTACDRDMNPATRDICRAATCVASTCGDGFVDPGGGEDCEDGNSVNGDGCDNDCTYSCAVAADCSDGLVCNGAETCNTTTHRCVAGAPPPNGTVCDRDMNPATRDICRAATCVASRCGDGYLDMGTMPPEVCDDGNLVAGDGCEPDCTPTGGPRPTAFRINSLDLMDPHIYVSFIGCRDVTDSPLLGFSVNGELQNSIDDYTINYITVHRPLNLAVATNPMDLVDGTCTSAAPMPPICDIGPMGLVFPSTAHNMGVGSTCFTPDPTRLNSAYSRPNTVTGPCFVSDPVNIVVTISGTPIPLRDAIVTATYSGGVPPNQLVSGVLTGFLTEADARAAILPASLPLVGGDSIWQHLAAARASGSSCSTRDDRDTYMGTTGFWFFLNFTATLADWVGP